MCQPTMMRAGILKAWGVIAVLMATSAAADADPGESIGEIAERMEPGQWYELPDTRLKDVFPDRDGHPHWARMGPKAVTRASSGGAFDTKRNRLFLKGGGHYIYGGNEVYQFDLEAMEWSRVTEPSEHEPDPEFADKGNANRYFRTVDDTPVSRHTYDGMVYLPNVDKILLWGGSLYSAGTPYDRHAWLFDPETHEWQRGAPSKGSQETVNSGYDPEQGWAILEYGYGIYGYDPAADRWHVVDGQNNANHGRAGAVDPERGLYIEVYNPHSDAPVIYFDLNRPAGRQTPEVSGDTDFAGRPTPGIEYHAPTGYMVLWNGYGRTWVLDPETWEAKKLEPRPGRAPDHIGTDRYAPRGYKTQGIFGRWAYVPDYDVFVAYGHSDDNVWLYRLPEDPFEWEPPDRGELVAAGEIKECPAHFCVGPDFEYEKPSEVANRVLDGNVVAIQAGEYQDCARWRHSVTIKGLGGRPKIGNKICRDKAVWITQGDETIIENVELVGGSSGGRNGDGIRHEGRLLVVRDSVLHGHRMGILTNHDPDIELEIYNSEFHSMRSHSGLAHQVYAARIKRFVAEGNFLHEGDLGHALKSVASENRIRNNYVRIGSDARAALVDLWGCSDTEVMGNIFAYAGTTGALQAISLVHRNHQGQRLDCDREPTALIAYNTAVFLDDHHRWSSFVRNKFGVEYTIANNLVVNTRDLEFRESETGLGTLTGNVHLGELPSNLFLDVEGDDFRLSEPPGAEAEDIDRPPEKIYRHPAGTAERGGTKTPGAYEAGN